MCVIVGFPFAITCSNADYRKKHQIGIKSISRVRQQRQEDSYNLSETFCAISLIQTVLINFRILIDFIVFHLVSIQVLQVSESSTALLLRYEVLCGLK